MYAKLCAMSWILRTGRKCRDQPPATTPVAGGRAEAQRKATGAGRDPCAKPVLALLPQPCRAPKTAAGPGSEFYVPRVTLFESTRGWDRMCPCLLFVFGVLRS